MKNAITIREAVTETDTAVFWTQLYHYFERDIFPEISDREDEDRAYFLGEEYRDAWAPTISSCSPPIINVGEWIRSNKSYAS